MSAVMKESVAPQPSTAAMLEVNGIDTFYGESQALFGDGLLDLAGLHGLGGQRPGDARGVLGEEDRESPAVGRPTRCGDESLDARELPGSAAGSVGNIELELACSCDVGQKRDALAIRRPRDTSFRVGRGSDAEGDPSGCGVLLHIAHVKGGLAGGCAVLPL